MIVNRLVCSVFAFIVCISVSCVESNNNNVPLPKLNPNSFKKVSDFDNIVETNDGTDMKVVPRCAHHHPKNNSILNSRASDNDDFKRESDNYRRQMRNDDENGNGLETTTSLMQMVGALIASTPSEEKEGTKEEEGKKCCTAIAREDSELNNRPLTGNVINGKNKAMRNAQRHESIVKSPNAMVNSLYDVDSPNSEVEANGFESGGNGGNLKRQLPLFVHNWRQSAIQNGGNDDGRVDNVETTTSLMQMVGALISTTPSEEKEETEQLTNMCGPGAASDKSNFVQMKPCKDKLVRVAARQFRLESPFYVARSKRQTSGGRVKNPYRDFIKMPVLLINALSDTDRIFTSPKKRSSSDKLNPDLSYADALIKEVQNNLKEAVTSTSQVRSGLLILPSADGERNNLKNDPPLDPNLGEDLLKTHQDEFGSNLVDLLKNVEALKSSDVTMRDFSSTTEDSCWIDGTKSSNSSLSGNFSAGSDWSTSSDEQNGCATVKQEDQTMVSLESSSPPPPLEMQQYVNNTSTPLPLASEVSLTNSSWGESENVNKSDSSDYDSDVGNILDVLAVSTGPLVDLTNNTEGNLVVTQQSVPTLEEQESTTSTNRSDEFKDKLKTLQKDLKMVVEVQDILNGAKNPHRRKRQVNLSDVVERAKRKCHRDKNAAGVGQIPPKIVSQVMGLGKILEWRRTNQDNANKQTILVQKEEEKKEEQEKEAEEVVEKNIWKYSRNGGAPFFRPELTKFPLSDDERGGTLVTIDKNDDYKDYDSDHGDIRHESKRDDGWFNFEWPHSRRKGETTTKRNRAEYDGKWHPYQWSHGNGTTTTEGATSRFVKGKSFMHAEPVSTSPVEETDATILQNGEVWHKLNWEQHEHPTTDNDISQDVTLGTSTVHREDSDKSDKGWVHLDWPKHDESTENHNHVAPPVVLADGDYAIVENPLEKEEASKVEEFLVAGEVESTSLNLLVDGEKAEKEPGNDAGVPLGLTDLSADNDDIRGDAETSTDGNEVNSGQNPNDGVDTSEYSEENKMEEHTIRDFAEEMNLARDLEKDRNVEEILHVIDSFGDGTVTSSEYSLSKLMENGESIRFEGTGGYGGIYSVKPGDGRFYSSVDVITENGREDVSKSLHRFDDDKDRVSIEDELGADHSLDREEMIGQEEASKIEGVGDFIPGLESETEGSVEGHPSESSESGYEDSQETSTLIEFSKETQPIAFTEDTETVAFDVSSMIADVLAGMTRTEGEVDVEEIAPSTTSDDSSESSSVLGLNENDIEEEYTFDAGTRVEISTEFSFLVKPFTLENEFTSDDESTTLFASDDISSVYGLIDEEIEEDTENLIFLGKTRLEAYTESVEPSNLVFEEFTTLFDSRVSESEIQNESTEEKFPTDEEDMEESSEEFPALEEESTDSLDLVTSEENDGSEETSAFYDSDELSSVLGLNDGEEDTEDLFFLGKTRLEIFTESIEPMTVKNEEGTEEASSFFDSNELSFISNLMEDHVTEESEGFRNPEIDTESKSEGSPVGEITEGGNSAGELLQSELMGEPYEGTKASKFHASEESTETYSGEMFLTEESDGSEETPTFYDSDELSSVLGLNDGEEDTEDLIFLGKTHLEIFTESIEPMTVKNEEGTEEASSFFDSNESSSVSKLMGDNATEESQGFRSPEIDTESKSEESHVVEVMKGGNSAKELSQSEVMEEPFEETKASKFLASEESTETYSGEMFLTEESDGSEETPTFYDSDELSSVVGLNDGEEDTEDLIFLGKTRLEIFTESVEPPNVEIEASSEASLGLFWDQSITGGTALPDDDVEQPEMKESVYRLLDEAAIDGAINEALDILSGSGEMVTKVTYGRERKRSSAVDENVYKTKPTNSWKHEKHSETSTICEICDEIDGKPSTRHMSHDHHQTPRHFSKAHHETSTLCEICDETTIRTSYASEDHSPAATDHRIETITDLVTTLRSLPPTHGQSSTLCEICDTTHRHDHITKSHSGKHHGHETSTLCELCDEATKGEMGGEFVTKPHEILRNWKRTEIPQSIPNDPSEIDYDGNVRNGQDSTISRIQDDEDVTSDDVTVVDYDDSGSQSGSTENVGKVVTAAVTVEVSHHSSAKSTIEIGPAEVQESLELTEHDSSDDQTSTIDGLSKSPHDGEEDYGDLSSVGSYEDDDDTEDVPSGEPQLESLPTVHEVTAGEIHQNVSNSHDHFSTSVREGSERFSSSTINGFGSSLYELTSGEHRDVWEIVTSEENSSILYSTEAVNTVKDESEVQSTGSHVHEPEKLSYDDVESDDGLPEEDDHLSEVAIDDHSVSTEELRKATTSKHGEEVATHKTQSSFLDSNDKESETETENQSIEPEKLTHGNAQTEEDTEADADHQPSDYESTLATGTEEQESSHTPEDNASVSEQEPQAQTEVLNLSGTHSTEGRAHDHEKLMYDDGEKLYDEPPDEDAHLPEQSDDDHSPADYGTSSSSVTDVEGKTDKATGVGVTIIPESHTSEETSSVMDSSDAKTVTEAETVSLNESEVRSTGDHLDGTNDDHPTSSANVSESKGVTGKSPEEPFVSKGTTETTTVRNRTKVSSVVVDTTEGRPSDDSDEMSTDHEEFDASTTHTEHGGNDEESSTEDEELSPTANDSDEDTSEDHEVGSGEKTSDDDDGEQTEYVETSSAGVHHVITDSSLHEVHTTQPYVSDIDETDDSTLSETTIGEVSGHSAFSEEETSVMLPSTSGDVGDSVTLENSEENTTTESLSLDNEEIGTGTGTGAHFAHSSNSEMTSTLTVIVDSSSHEMHPTQTHLFDNDDDSSTLTVVIDYNREHTSAQTATGEVFQTSAFSAEEEIGKTSEMLPSTSEDAITLEDGNSEDHTATESVSSGNEEILEDTGSALSSDAGMTSTPTVITDSSLHGIHSSQPHFLDNDDENDGSTKSESHFDDSSISSSSFITNERFASTHSIVIDYNQEHTSSDTGDHDRKTPIGEIFESSAFSGGEIGKTSAIVPSTSEDVGDAVTLEDDDELGENSTEHTMAESPFSYNEGMVTGTGSESHLAHSSESEMTATVTDGNEGNQTTEEGFGRTNGNENVDEEHLPTTGEGIGDVEDVSPTSGEVDASSQNGMTYIKMSSETPPHSTRSGVGHTTEVQGTDLLSIHEDSLTILPELDEVSTSDLPVDESWTVSDVWPEETIAGEVMSTEPYPYTTVHSSEKTGEDNEGIVPKTTKTTNSFSNLTFGTTLVLLIASVVGNHTTSPLGGSTQPSIYVDLPIFIPKTTETPVTLRAETEESVTISTDDDSQHRTNKIDNDEHKCVILYVNSPGEAARIINGTKWVPSLNVNIANRHESTTRADSVTIGEFSPKELKLPQNFELSKSCSNDTIDGCFCAMDGLVTSMRGVLSKNGGKSPIVTCDHFVRVVGGLMIGNDSIAEVRVRRSYLYGAGDEVKRETIDYSTSGYFDDVFALKNTGNHVFTLQDAKVSIECPSKNAKDGELNRSTKYSWTFDNKLPISGQVQDEDGSLVIDNVLPKDGGNYTCTLDSQPPRIYHHDLVVVSTPIFRIKTTVIYALNETCDLMDADIMYNYLPHLFDELLCGFHETVCKVDIQRPRCINRQEEGKLLNVTFIVTMDQLAKILPALDNNLCDINCQMGGLLKLVQILVRNVQILETLTIHSRIDVKQLDFTPKQIVAAKQQRQKGGGEYWSTPPILIVSCPGGYGVDKKHPKICVACPVNTFSTGNESYCKVCPPGQYQPVAGSKTCIVCSSPLENAACLRVLYKEGEHFEIYIGVAFGGVLVMIVGIVYCSMRKSTGDGGDDSKDGKNVSKKRKYNPDVVKRRRSRIDDVELGVTEPLLRSTEPPEVPPLDF